MRSKKNSSTEKLKGDIGRLKVKASYFLPHQYSEPFQPPLSLSHSLPPPLSNGIIRKLWAACRVLNFFPGVSH